MQCLVKVMNIETRKNWGAPELKKTGIEQITANHITGATSDGTNRS